MRKLWIPAILVFVCVAMGSAQSLIENATAAAGGTAAGVAGKQVSDGLDKVFGKLGQTTKKAADTGPRKTAPAASPVPEVRVVGRTAAATSASQPTARTGAGRRQAGKPSAGDLARVQGETIETTGAPAGVTAPPPPPLPTLDDLKSLSGATREEVASKMGRPASRITMGGDEGGLVEIMSFKGENGKLGSVRMVNGKVTEVRPVEQ